MKNGEIGRANGFKVQGNSLFGVEIKDGSDNELRNVTIVANGSWGVKISGSDAVNNVIERSAIGVDFFGNDADGESANNYENKHGGVGIDHAPFNTVFANWIANNGGPGIKVENPHAENGRLNNNRIGGDLEVDSASFLPRGNQGHGTPIDDPPFTQITDAGSAGGGEILFENTNSITGRQRSPHRRSRKRSAPGLSK